LARKTLRATTACQSGRNLLQRLPGPCPNILDYSFALIELALKTRLRELRQVTGSVFGIFYRIARPSLGSLFMHGSSPSVAACFSEHLKQSAFENDPFESSRSADKHQAPTAPVCA
jgi:hypothetical protein